MGDKSTAGVRVQDDVDRFSSGVIEPSQSSPPTVLRHESSTLLGEESRSISLAPSVGGGVGWPCYRQGSSRVTSSRASSPATCSEACSVMGSLGQLEDSLSEFRGTGPPLATKGTLEGSGLVFKHALSRRGTRRGSRFGVSRESSLGLGGPKLNSSRTSRTAEPPAYGRIRRTYGAPSSDTQAGSAYVASTRVPVIFSQVVPYASGWDEAGYAESKKFNHSHSSLSTRFVNQVHQETASGMYPLWSADVVLRLCLLGALFFIFVGAWLIFEDEHHVECKLNYAEKTPQEGSSRYLLKGISSADCTRDVDELKGEEISVYAELEHFYQNDAQILWSRNDRQLAGTIFTDPSDVRDCEPLATAVVDNVTKVLHPCGALAWGVFTDKYQFLEGTPEGDNDQVPMKPIPLDQSQTVVLQPWPWQDTYKNPPASHRAAVLDKVYFWMSPVDNDDGDDAYKTREEARAELLMDRLNYEEAGEMVENGHFIQWMQTAALGTFRKLYGRLEGPLRLPVSAHITVMYDVSSWKGKKAIVLVQKSRFGGRSLFLGIMYLSLGFLLAMLVFYMLWKKWQYRREGEEIRDLRWQTKSRRKKKTK
ncbi:putative transmembrane domain-containing protein [Neospora caninum Liverpool]|uniref:Putative transmembrane domain-containing protein n=1 Tax=Neospora caninum (strain Liverpool) TaxID=572307 RepID=F0VHX4_NEOCL|nr:putative transmembrane domain-containing protein [Neospora caninum Liverpool]CBZ53335.1 putative transmembrane domain-containing protein [Neospora caninum Liverpool]CEL67320.1 TPA: transmembrane domain-containing protein,putative [Neospora caninum Liverpool]|eukprot:XP_003883367.1 putative transmembrane domain-containing protein [Neospora caninum Liverpool]